MGLPGEIQPLLDTYQQRLQSQIPGLLYGLYLQGSIALGAFNPVSSDIDFVAVLNRPATPSEITNLRTIHEQIAAQFPGWKLEGSYFQLADLGKYDAEVPPVPCIHDGKFRDAGQHDVNAVTWWILKNRGVTLFGPEAQTLPFDVDWSVLVRRMDENLHTYWASWTRQPAKLVTLLTDWGIEWTVLGILRLYYTANENSITSKVGAGQYALSHVPEPYHRVISEAIRIREEPQAASLYRVKPLRALAAYRVIQWVLTHTVFAPA